MNSTIALASVFNPFPERLGNTEDAQRDGKPIDPGQQFRLLLLVHVLTRVIQKPLVIPVHRECALADQDDDQTDNENSEDHRHNCHCHSPTPQIPLGWSYIPARKTDQ
jgi:hypothetical protein